MAKQSSDSLAQEPESPAIAAEAASKPTDVHASGQMALRRILDEAQPGAAQIHRQLEHLAALSDVEFSQAVDDLSVAETEKLLTSISAADKKTYATLMRRFSNERVVGAAKAELGKLYWAGPSGPIARQAEQTHRPSDDMHGEEQNQNDFITWLLGGPEPDPVHGKMNCWESVIYCAHRAGIISREWIIRNIYGKENTYDSLLAGLGYAHAAQISSGHEPASGDIVFMKGLDHVCLSLGTKDSAGNHEVLSLWILPLTDAHYDSVMQRTTIERLVTDGGMKMSDVRFSPSPW